MSDDFIIDHLDDLEPAAEAAAEAIRPPQPEPPPSEPRPEKLNLPAMVRQCGNPS